jgi:DNA-binding transcriptional LysR family regulator
MLVVTLPPIDFVDVLARDQVDLMLAASVVVPGIRSQPVHDEPFVTVLRRGHPALQQRLTAKRFAALDHVMISPRGKTSGHVDPVLRKRGYKRRVAVVVPSLHVAATIVASSDLVLTTGRRSADIMRRYLPLEVTDTPIRIEPFSVMMHWHERNDRDPFSLWARARIVEIMTQLGKR